MATLDEVMYRMEQLLVEIDGHVDKLEPPPSEMIAELASLVGIERAKVDAIGGLMKRLRQSAELCENEAKSLKERADRFERRRDRIAGYVMAVMQANGTKKVEGDKVTLTMLAGRDRVVIENDNAFVITAHDTFVRRIPEMLEPDKQAIKDALMKGDDVPGATLVRGEPTLRVYT
jgi:hypothetical protein